MSDFRAPAPARYRILAMLTGFSLVSYLLRMNISVAQQYNPAQRWSGTDYVGSSLAAITKVAARSARLFIVEFFQPRHLNRF